MKNLVLAFVLMFAVMSSPIFALNSSSIVISTPLVLASSGDYDVAVVYKDIDGFKIDSANVTVCYAYGGSDSCFATIENASSYVFTYNYDGTSGGLLAFNATGSIAGFDDASVNFSVEMSTSNYTSRFWQDNSMVNAYANENLWVFGVPTCEGLLGYEFDSCNVTAFHTGYINSTSTLRIYGGNFSLWVVDGNVIWGDDLSVPVISDYTVLVNFDNITIGNAQSGHGNYLWDTTFGLGFGLNWGFWSSVVGLIILLTAVCLVAYGLKESSAGWVVVILVFIIVYAVLKYIGILSGAILWIF